MMLPGRLCDSAGLRFVLTSSFIVAEDDGAAVDACGSLLVVALFEPSRLRGEARPVCRSCKDAPSEEDMMGMKPRCGTPSRSRQEVQCAGAEQGF